MAFGYRLDRDVPISLGVYVAGGGPLPAPLGSTCGNEKPARLIRR
jgi:hypothetical protein